MNWPETYLRVLEGRAGDALRIVDKSPINSDYLRLIHSVFPCAQIIDVRRDPIDTCLSCYFQKFVLSVNITMDLSDYYRQHRRLMAHWRAVLPPARSRFWLANLCGGHHLTSKHSRRVFGR